VKLPVHRAGLPGKELFHYIVPLDPACRAGLAGALPVDGISVESDEDAGIFGRWYFMIGTGMGRF